MDLIKAEAFALINWLKDRWHRRSAILVLNIILLFLCLSFFHTIDLGKITFYQWIFIGFILLVSTFVWLYSRRLPKNTHGKIGLIVAIATENEQQNNQIKNDFVDRLNQEIAKGNLQYSFKVIVYPEYYAKKMTDAAVAIRYLKLSHSHYMLFGRCKERNINGKPHFVIDLQGAVSHNPIPFFISTIFSNEFRELLPRRMEIPKENDLFEFEVASDSISIVTRYIIGIASFLSGDLDYSRSLFYSVRSEITANPTINSHTSIIKIKKRLPLRLSEVLYQMAIVSYKIYMKSTDVTYLDQLENILNELSRVKHDLYGGRLLKSNFIFLKSRDCREAIKELNKVGPAKDATWYYNYAFLKAYCGDLRMAHARYQKAFDNICEDRIPLDCEEFINEILALEPDKYQLHYCVGMINFHAKKDYESAKKDFETFLLRCPINKYKDQRIYSEARINECQRKL